MTPERETHHRALAADVSLEPELAAIHPSLAAETSADEVRRLNSDLQEAYAKLHRAETRMGTLSDLLARIEGSGSYRLARSLAEISRRVAPAGTARQRLLSGARAIGVTAGADPRLLLTPGPPLDSVDLRWNHYCRRHDPGPWRLRGMRALARSWEEPPLVSVLMPTYNPSERFLRAAIDSVQSQAYERWELCIVDDGSPTHAAARTLAAYRGDPRIRFTEAPSNGGIARATQTGADMASGDVLAFFDHDDVLRPHALFEMVRYLRDHQECEIVYSDEDKLDRWGRRVGAHLKPDWSPELMESCNYITHLTVMRRELFDRAGGFRTGFDGSQDYDLYLRCAELAMEIGHVREVLYSWRMHDGSVAGSTLAKPEAYLAAIRCLEDHLDRSGDVGTVVNGAWKGAYHVRRAIVGTPTIAVIIPTRDAVDLLRQSVACVERELGPYNLRIVIVDNDSSGRFTREYLDRCGHLVVPGHGAFNFSWLVNLGVAAAGEVDHVLLLNNDVAGGSPGWIHALLEHSQRSGVGAVGARLLYEDGTTQHEGIRVGGQGVVADNLDLSGYFGMGLATRTVSAVTGACLMVKRALWQEVGGFDETMPVAYNDVDFCLRLLHAGYRNVYTPLAELTHLESATRGRHHPAEDERLFASRWGPFPQGYDRYIGGHIWSFKPIDYR
jgi:GT2 family glycosyltransferase